MSSPEKGSETVAMDTMAEKPTQPTGGVFQADEENQKQGDNEVSKGLQDGVAKVEATTLIWQIRDLIIAYIIIWFIYFITSTQEVVVRALSPFVVSSFQMHSSTALIGVVSSIVGGLSKLPLAKILDTWGRPQGLLISLVLWIIGFIMMAVCKDATVYGAAQVFSVVGAQAVSYCITIFVADTSTLASRPLMLAFATSPYIVTTWIGGPISDSVLDGIGWRWGFGVWAIVTPVVVLPLIGLFFLNQMRAKKAGLLADRPNKAFNLQTVVYVAKEIDVVGIILLAGGMCLFLMGLGIYSYQEEGWQSPLIISFLVVGPILIIAFFLYESFLAPVKFIPPHLLADRTVFLAGVMLFFVFFNSAVWGSYFNSMLVIVWNQSVTNATYISNIYRVGSCFSAVVIGFFIRMTGRFKWTAMYFALPLMILGVGLLIHFRLSEHSIGYVIMTQIFIAFAGGPIVIAGEMAMMAPLDRQYIAVIIAVLDLFCSVGTAAGSAVSAAIWTTKFKSSLVEHLQDEAMAEKVYGSIYTQLAYKVGNPIRTGISLAYGDSQRIMAIVSTACLACAWVAVWFWRDINIKDIKHVKGTVV